MSKDRERAPSGTIETDLFVYKCCIKDCTWMKSDLQLWQALREYGDHFNSRHPGEPFASAYLIEQAPTTSSGKSA